MSRPLRGISEKTTTKTKKESCAVCLEPPKVLAWLDSCQHTFCFDCIKAWSEQNNVCPLCKERFHRISSRRRKIQVETPDPSSDGSFEPEESSSDWDPDSYDYETYEIESGTPTEPDEDLSPESSSSGIVLELEENYKKDE